MYARSGSGIRVFRRMREGYLIDTGGYGGFAFVVDPDLFATAAGATSKVLCRIEIRSTANTNGKTGNVLRWPWLQTVI